MTGQPLNGVLLAPTSDHQRLTDTAAQWIAQALRTAAIGERVIWETALQLMPTPQGQPQPILVIYLQIPSRLIGQFLGELIAVEPAQATEQTVGQLVADAVGRLFTARAQATVLPPT